MNFQDHFSRSADVYARFRPTYPSALYATLARLLSERRLAWDCATGSGQAAVGLAAHFDRVLATDASPEQLAQALPHPRVNYALAYAEKLPLGDDAVDLVAVAAGVHWFDLDLFYDEVRRVLRPEGVIALWSYYSLDCEPAIRTVMNDFSDHVVGPYWPAALQHNRDRYETLPFPFEPIDVPEFHAEARWTMDDMLGYANTWSATRRYTDAHGTHPNERILDDLTAAWGDPGRLVDVRWPLHVLVGRHR